MELRDSLYHGIDPQLHPSLDIEYKLDLCQLGSTLRSAHRPWIRQRVLRILDACTEKAVKLYKLFAA